MLAYVAAALIGRRTATGAHELGLVWPAAGVAFVWFMVTPRGRGLAVDAVLLAGLTVTVDVATGAAAVDAVIFAAATVVQTLLATWLFRRGSPAGARERGLWLRSVADVWRLLAVALVAGVVGSLIGPAGTGLLSGDLVLDDVALWLTRTLTSIVVTGSAGLLLWQLLLGNAVPGAAGDGGDEREPRKANRLELVALLVSSVVLYLLAFAVDRALPMAFPLLTVTVWAGLRFSPVFVTGHGLVLGTAGVVSTLRGWGPFADIDALAVRAMFVQGFVLLVVVVGLVLAMNRLEQRTLRGELEASRSRSEEHAGLLTAVLDALHEGVVLLDAAGEVIVSNRASRELLAGQQSLRHLDGRPLDTDDLPFRRAITGRPVRGRDFLLPGGEAGPERVLRFDATPLLGGHTASDAHALVVFRDVTADQRHRDELAAFAGVVAHDLLNPLAAIEGWSEALRELVEADPDPARRSDSERSLDRIERAGSRMRELITTLLANTTARDSPLRPVHVDLDTLVHELTTGRRTDGHVAPRFTVDIGADVHAEPVLTLQLLDNLIGNALKYVAPGERPAVTITSTARDGWTTVHVDDNGIGIPPGQQERIFDNFHRAHAQDYAGTGLGLATCKRIVERHGGTIVAGDNPAGRGARFTFTLPAAEDPVDAPEQ